MEYMFTFADWATLFALATVALIVVLHWPTSINDPTLGPPAPIVVVRMGKNATRFRFDGTTNTHEIMLDGPLFPRKGDIIHVIEVDRTLTKMRVVDIAASVVLAGRPETMLLLAMPI